MGSIFQTFWPNFLVGLREGLEASLVVGILVAYLVKLNRRDLLGRLWLGVGIAIVISLGFGAALTFGPSGLSFEAQELIGGSLSILAVILITGMLFWMGKTARNLKSGLQDKLGEAISKGGAAVTVMSMLAVGREGLETALFLWAGAQSAGGGGRALGPVLGAVAGILVAVVIGYLIYRGAVRINLAVFFRWTGLFLVFVAAGILAYGVHDLQEARFLPGLENKAFDISNIALLSPTSVLGTILKGIFNFQPDPTVLQVVVYLAYLVPVLFIFWRVSWGRRRPVGPPAPAAATPTSPAATAVASTSTATSTPTIPITASTSAPTPENEVRS